MNKINEKCYHYSLRKDLWKEKREYLKKHCLECQKYRNEKCLHTDEERSFVGTWATVEIQKALQFGYKILEIYEVEHFEKKSNTLFKEYVRKFMKIKNEASGCPFV